MYRITQLDDDPSAGDITLRVEGRLLEDSSAELVHIRERLDGRLRRLRLDLRGVTYVDGAAVEALCGFIAGGAIVSCSSSFVRELLKECKP